MRRFLQTDCQAKTLSCVQEIIKYQLYLMKGMGNQSAVVGKQEVTYVWTLVLACNRLTSKTLPSVRN